MWRGRREQGGKQESAGPDTEKCPEGRRSQIKAIKRLSDMVTARSPNHLIRSRSRGYYRQKADVRGMKVRTQGTCRQLRSLAGKGETLCGQRQVRPRGKAPPIEVSGQGPEEREAADGEEGVGETGLGERGQGGARAEGERPADSEARGKDVIRVVSRRVHQWPRREGGMGVGPSAEAEDPPPQEERSLHIRWHFPVLSFTLQSTSP